MAHEISLLDQIVTASGTARAWHLFDTQHDLNAMTSREGADVSGPTGVK